MKEAKPAEVLPPPSQPNLRIGILIDEDRLTTASFSVPNANYTLGANFPSLQPKTTYTIKSTLTGLDLLDQANNLLISSADPIKIFSLKPIPISPQSGIKIHDVPVGRGFHWRKTINETFAGSLEFHHQNSSLLLINEIPFEDYLACVISSEMSPECPKEFAKAQAVAARSWALVFLSNKHPGCLYSVCNDDDCQRYQGTTHLTSQSIDAINRCKGEILLTPTNFVCPTYYSKCCGGHTESPENIFGFSAPGNDPIFDLPNSPESSIDFSDEKNFSAWLTNPTRQTISPFCSPNIVSKSKLKKYLGAVDITNDYFRWQVTIDQDQLCKNLQTNFNLKDLSQITNLIILKRGHSGRILKMEIEYLNSTGSAKKLLLENQYNIRKALDPSFLYSSAFIFQLNKSPQDHLQSITLQGLGWGHGVGLCQIGALGMALTGHHYHEILTHYYPNTIFAIAY